MIDRATLYQAYSAAYGKERDHQLTVQLVDFGLLVVAIGAAAFDSQWPHVSAIALLWLFLREAPWFLRPNEYRRIAVNLQEQFDCSFGIPPNEVLTGDPVPDHQVLALANRSTTSFEEDFFVDVTGLEPEVAIVLMQHQTVTWAELGHDRYSRLNYVLAFAAAVGLAVWSYVSEMTVQEAVTQIFAPAAPFVVGRLQLARRHEKHGKARAEIRKRAETALGRITIYPFSHPSLTFVRALQDRIYQSRLTEDRIPGLLYRIRAEKDRKSIDASCQARAETLMALYSDERRAPEASNRRSVGSNSGT